jgi:AcrR family transcriptional regulator
MAKELTSEEKIKAAAKTIFMRKGYAGTKTRDIAEEAGINLALLNYYYRSKEKLFNEIMTESLREFLSTIMFIYDNPHSSLEEKIDLLSKSYILKLIDQPDIPLFVLNELQSHPEKFLDKMKVRDVGNSVFIEQVKDELTNKQLNPLHIIMNLLGIILFPFIAKSMFQGIFNIDPDSYQKILLERKELIPKWINDMI